MHAGSNSGCAGDEKCGINCSDVLKKMMGRSYDFTNPAEVEAYEENRQTAKSKQQPHHRKIRRL